MDRVRDFLWNPIGWLSTQLVEVVALTVLIDAVVSDEVDAAVRATIWVLGLAGLFGTNLAIRRRLLPTDSPPRPAEFSAVNWVVAVVLFAGAIAALAIFFR